MRQQRSHTLDTLKVSAVTDQFSKRLYDLRQVRHLYAFTITPSLRYIRDNVDSIGEWYDTRINNRERFVMGIYNRLIHRISSSINSNYKRNKHKDKSPFSLVCVEHQRQTAKGKKQISPHIHAVISIHPEWNDKFLSLFTYMEKDKEGRDVYSLNDDFYMDRGLFDLQKQIVDVRLKSQCNQNEWISYGTKHLDMNYQGTGVYLSGELCG